ncbi:integrase core domain-containing protein [Corynebacterium urealyticum]|uniref:integrase core domain-containing protein n=1 Tax=Corynebacterium urealyticum TaxID=43771 RepID=UPI0009DA119A|nr:integrase core domain-containing protein [Corynebacterium urealyticum]
MSALLSMESLPLLGQSVTPTTMLWPRTSTVLTKNELIHRRSWTDVVDVEIATFEWVSWWNESRLHQSLGYRTPTEVEAEFWTGNPNHEKIEIKANA